MPAGIKGTENDVIGHRIAAIIIDWIILWIVSFFVLGATFVGMLGSMNTFSVFSFVSSLFAVILISFLYGFILEGWRGQTLGKMALGIMVVKEDGKSCDYPAAFLRNILRIIDALPFAYILGLIVIALTKRRQRIGDIVAKTVVVKAK